MSNFCTDAGFLTTVEVGQYFLTKDTEEFSQVTKSVAYREYTLSRDEDSSEPKGWIRGNTQIGPVLEVTTSYLQGKYGVEIRIESLRDEKSTDPKGWVRGNTQNGPVLEVTTSYLQGEYGVEIIIEAVNRGNSHSWVRISHGLNKLVTDLIDKEYDDNQQETSETKTETFALKTECTCFLRADQRPKQNPRRPTSACSSTRTVPIREKNKD